MSICSAIFIQDLYVVCLYEAQISGERLHDHWSSGLQIIWHAMNAVYVYSFYDVAVVNLFRMHDVRVEYDRDALH